MDPLVSFEDIAVTLAAKQILTGVSLNVAEGEILMLLGRSGSGKTTLLKLVNRLVTPSSGRVVVNGRDVMESEVIGLRRGIGYAIQNVGLMPHMTVAENVGLLPRLQAWKQRDGDARVRELLELVGLAASFHERYPRHSSGGEQQRVGIARALANDPPLLLMDEPFGALDPVTRSQLQQDFAELVKRLKKTVIFVTHDLHEALRIGDRVAFLHAGRVVGVRAAEDFESAQEEPVREYVAAFRDGTSRLKQ